MGLIISQGGFFMENLKAVIYARYSSNSQREESIEGQIRDCTAYAERNGYMVIGAYADRAISGTTDDRSEFQKMIKDSKPLAQVVRIWIASLHQTASGGNSLRTISQIRHYRSVTMVRIWIVLLHQKNALAFASAFSVYFRISSRKAAHFVRNSA